MSHYDYCSGHGAPGVTNRLNLAFGGSSPRVNDGRSNTLREHMISQG